MYDNNIKYIENQSNLTYWATLIINALVVEIAVGAQFHYIQIIMSCPFFIWSYYFLK